MSFSSGLYKNSANGEVMCGQYTKYFFEVSLNEGGFTI
jgi:hypothetical protein